MLSLRVKSLKPSPTLALAAKAKELEAQGLKVVSLSVGEPDWNTFAPICEAGIQAIQKGQTRYSPANGLPKLREAIAAVTNKELGTNYTPMQVTVTAGAKFVLFSAFQALIDEGDEVLIPAPFWVSYPTMVELAGAKSVIVETAPENRFCVTAKDLERYVTPKTKMLILNSPSNPTGEILGKDELAKIAEFLRKHPRIVVISDDIYNHLAFNQTLAPQILQVAPDLIDRVITVNGVSKTYAMTGWRLGWALGPQPVISAMTNYQSQSVSCAATMTQVASIEALKMDPELLANAISDLKKRRDLACELFNKIKGLSVKAPDGAFYLWVDIRKSKYPNSQTFCAALLEQHRVAAVPGIEFGVEGYIRCSYAVAESDIRLAAQKLTEFLS